MCISLTVFIICAVVFGTVAGCCTFSVPGYKGPKADHFDGKRFFNQENSREQGFLDFLKWVTTRDAPTWHKVEAAIPEVKLPAQVGPGTLQITFVNHSTVLIQMDGINILTDPLWAERTSPVSFSGPQRMHPPGMHIEALPPIDVIVVSHNHYDHMDVSTIKKIADRDRPKIFVGLGNMVILDKAGIAQVREMDWWEQEQLSDAVILTFVPARHFSNRGMCDHNKALWGGFVFESTGGAVYFAGDTGFGRHFEQVAQRFKKIRLTLLPIGAFQPEWFMSTHHLSPKDALRAHFILRANTSLALHYGTFRLGDDKQNEPVETLQTAISTTDMGNTQFCIMHFGETRQVPLLK